MKHIESNHQQSLIKWAQVKRLPVRKNIQSNSRLIDYLFAIENEGAKTIKQGARSKAMGVKAGVSDLCLALPMKGSSALWIEMKRPIVKGKAKPVVSESQKEWLERMELAGSVAAVCYGWGEARAIIELYLTRGEACTD